MIRYNCCLFWNHAIVHNKIRWNFKKSWFNKSS